MSSSLAEYENSEHLMEIGLSRVIEMALSPTASHRERTIAAHALMYEASLEKKSVSYDSWAQVVEVIRRHVLAMACGEKTLRCFLLRCPHQVLNRKLCLDVLSTPFAKNLGKRCNMTLLRIEQYDAVTIVAVAAWFLREDWVARVEQFLQINDMNPKRQFLLQYLAGELSTLDI